MTKKVLSIQDISCYGQCSLTVALPILSHYGIETAILPSAILSTHTCGFTNFTVHDLTSEMPKIIDHWVTEHITFDCIYTGYIGDRKQFDIILNNKHKLLKEDGLFIVDPAMADNGKLYPGLDEFIVLGMKKMCMEADYIIPNVTEACLLTGIEYVEPENQTMDYYYKLLQELYKLGAKNIILTGVYDGLDTIGAISFDGITRTTVLKEKEEKSYHGTGDIFSSVVIADILNGKSIRETLHHATDFIIDAIHETADDDSHSYGVKFEQVLLKEEK
jgi:pyridoxine kinase